jgi:nucleoid-associated protein YgaU
VPGRPARRLRLTRRAHVLVLVLALAAAVAMGSWLGSVAGAGAGDLRLAGDRTVVVRSGDTVWSIATSLGNDGDVRALVDEIQRINGLEGPDGADLHPGQELRLP